MRSYGMTPDPPHLGPGLRNWVPRLGRPDPATGGCIRNALRSAITEARGQGEGRGRQPWGDDPPLSVVPHNRPSTLRAEGPRENNTMGGTIVEMQSNDIICCRPTNNKIPCHICLNRCNSEGLTHKLYSGCMVFPFENRPIILAMEIIRERCSS